MSFATWKLLHVLGILVLFAALGGMAALHASGAAARAGKLYGALHGAALLVVLAAGFGALAAIGLHGPAMWPLWVWVKLLAWLALGAGVVALKRAGERSGLVLGCLVAVGAIAAWAALFKPTA
jgi:hypothetical protein